jgi:hypothetical protein
VSGIERRARAAAGAAALLAATVAPACGARSSLSPGEDASETAPDGGDLVPDLAWYRLDETSGTIAHDASPGHHDIPGLDGVVWGDGATFDDVTVCGETSVAPGFRTPPVTLTAWLTPFARADETSTTHALQPYPPDAVSGDVPSLGGYGLGFDVWVDGLPPGMPSAAALSVETGVNAPVAFHSLAGAFASGARHFVASVVDAATATVYVDGAVYATVPADTPPAVAATPLHLGCHNDDTGYLTKRFFKGTIRDVRIYQRLLTAAEVSTLHAAGPIP